MTRSLLIPGRSRPIAIVIQANVTGRTDDEHTIKETVDEANTVADLLHTGGYDVYQLTSGRYSELIDLLRNEDICERLVVFHYCGHADQSNVSLLDDNGTPIPISAHGLQMQMATDSRALRIVYINGCRSESQDEDYRAAFPNVNFIGAKIDIPDYFASWFARRFYERLVGSDFPYGQTTVAKALMGTAGEDMAKMPERIEAVMALTSLVQDTEPAPHMNGTSARPDVFFKLADGKGLIASHVLKQWQHRSPLVALLYVSAVIVLTGVTLWLSHVWNATSSPAFQAAFGYRPDCATLLQLIDRTEGIMKIGSHDCADELTPSDPLRSLDPRFGFLVEWGRSIILCICMLIIGGVIYRDMPRDHPQFLSGDVVKWITYRKHRFFVGLFCVGVLLVSAYHLTVAHMSLADMSENDLRSLTWLQARWPVFYESESLWAEFRLLLASFEDTSAIKSLEFGDPGYFELFVRPYLFYMGYSLLNYFATAMPILVVVVHGFVFGTAHIKLRLAEVQVRLRLTRDGFYESGRHVETLLRNARRDMKTDFLKFSVTFVLLTLFASYEVLIGRTTTAIFAQISAWLVFALMAGGVFHVLMIWNAYRDSLSDMEAFIGQVSDEAAMDRLDEFSKQLQGSYFPAGPIHLTLTSMGIIIFASMIYILLLGKHWTIFTHW